MKTKILTQSDYVRFDRQIALPQFDIEKQEQLKNSRFLMIGVGGLGCACALYLTNSGAGQLTLIDFDTISESNLPRQILYQQQDIGQFKAHQALKRLTDYNHDIDLQAISAKLEDNALFELIKQHDVIIDCSDNLVTREQINRGCFLYKKPLISGSAIRMEGWITAFTYQPNTPCYHCLSQLFSTNRTGTSNQNTNQAQHQESCVETGVLAPIVGMIGSMQALEAIKMATQLGHIKTGELKSFDMMNFYCRTFSYSKKPSCSVCGNASTI